MGALTLTLLVLVAASLGVWYGCDLPMGLVTELCYRRPDFSHKSAILLSLSLLLSLM